MDPGNQTGVLEFLLLGLSEDPGLQPLLFGLFLTMYLVTLLGNLFIILAVSSDPHLHTPMYFFLCNLSFSDICFSSTIVPKMLMNIQTQNKIITYAGCITQTSLFMVFAYLDNFLLTVMAYDRFVAICHPLHYIIIMNPHLCGLLVLISWLLSVIISCLHSLMLLRLSFCTHTEIPHFFCDFAEVLKYACSDTVSNYIVLFSVTGSLGVLPLAGILFSYFKIISSILKMSSAGGKYKAFSTCGSHLTVVSLFYGTGLGVYVYSAIAPSSPKGAIASVMYTVVTPMSNPFVYSLRNTDLNGALRKFSTGLSSACQESWMLELEKCYDKQSSKHWESKTSNLGFV
ncbi:olfactory receptor 7A10-like [Elephas maximus indicus]|uniref:olfactory receptor 7A10-like n=1 Tax=Elephas maximus indicus TaxID=99487 RepID=UPI002115E41D|nr:olfactory receptor 7A10-like [Elephas maximus indicus]